MGDYLRRNYESCATEAALFYLSKPRQNPVLFVAANFVPWIVGLVLLVTFFDYPIPAALLTFSGVLVMGSFFVARVRLRVVELRGATPADYAATR
jgi:hypothetical protein